MSLNINKAKELLIQGNYTCVVMKENVEYVSQERGVKPLLDWIDNKVDFENAVVADKVVGKAAAFLYVLFNVSEIYANVISEPAYDILKKHNINIFYNQMVKAIRNRDNTGFCPMESSVWAVEEPKEAYNIILKTRDELINKANQ